MMFEKYGQYDTIENRRIETSIINKKSKKKIKTRV